MPDPELPSQWHQQPPQPANSRDQITQLGVIAAVVLLAYLLLGT
jgi:hypothetical protein